MRLLLFALAGTAGCVLSPKADAAPRPALDANRPMVTVQVKSINELAAALKTTVRNCLSEDAFKVHEQKFLNEIDPLPEQIKCLAADKPFGLYATLGDGLVNGDLSKSSGRLACSRRGRKNVPQAACRIGSAVQKGRR